MKKFITASSTGRRRKPNGEKIGKGSIRNYLNCLRLIKQMEDKTGLSFSVCRSLKMTRQLFLERRRYWEKFYRFFSDHLYAKGYLDNYVSNQFRVLRTFLHYLHEAKGWHDHQYVPYRWVNSETISILVLTTERLQWLINNKPFNDCLTPQLKIIKDIFIAGCTTALRFSDLARLRKHNWITVGGKHYLAVISGKTKTQTRLLLPDYLIEIFRKYQNKYRTLLPPVAIGNFNLLVKRFCEKAGWIEPVVKTRCRRGVPAIIKSKKGPTRFCDLVTSHTMRRTAISTLLMMGMPEQLVRQISGHAPGSREFYRYVALNHQWQDRETEKAFQKLME